MKPDVRRGWNSSFAPRKKPLRRKLAAVWPSKREKAEGKPKPRKPFKKVSSARQRANKAYLAARIPFLREHPVCGACLAFGKTPAPTSQIHHLRGRCGRLLLDQRFWAGVCSECHEDIHRNPRMARELGLLAPASEFGVLPKE